MMAIFDVYSNDVKINGESFDLKMTIGDIIEVVKKNSGQHWGKDNLYIGSCFRFIVCQNDTLFIEWGDRFLQLITNDEPTKSLWSNIYKNGGKIFLGEITSEQRLDILQLMDRSVVFQTEDMQ